MQDHTNLPSGTKIDNYVIRRKIGSGGMGEIYLATDTKLSRDVALKFLSAAKRDDPNWLRRFEREARSAATLDNPHIVTVYQYGTFQGTPFIAMEYVRGRSLDEIVETGEYISNETLFNWMIQCCRGLHAAHCAGVVHRDIKPGNILVRNDGTVKIADFGLARSFSDTESTLSGVLAGTLPYMSPEQFTASAPDHRTDIYSLGVTFYQLATGRLPFQGESSGALMHAIIHEEPLSPEKLRPNISEPLTSTISKCLEKERDKRFEEAIEIISQLESSPAFATTELASDLQPLKRSSFLRARYLLGLAVIVTVALLSFTHLFDRSQETGTLSATPFSEDVAIVLTGFESLGEDALLKFLSAEFKTSIESKIKNNSRIEVQRVPRIEARLAAASGSTANVSTFLLDGRFDYKGDEITVSYELKPESDDNVLISGTSTAPYPSGFESLQDKIIADVFDRLGLALPENLVDPKGFQQASRTTREYLSKATFLMTHGENESAIELLRLAKRSDQTNLIIDYYLGSAFQALGEYDSAIYRYKLSLADISHKRFSWEVFGSNTFDDYEHGLSNPQNLVFSKHLESDSILYSVVNAFEFSRSFEFKIGSRDIVFPTDSNSYFWSNWSVRKSTFPEKIGVWGLNVTDGRIEWFRTDTSTKFNAYSVSDWAGTGRQMVVLHDIAAKSNSYFDVKSGECIELVSDTSHSDPWDAVEAVLLDSTLVVKYAHRRPNRLAIYDIGRDKQKFEEESIFYSHLHDKYVTFLGVNGVTTVDVASGKKVEVRDLKWPRERFLYAYGGDLILLAHSTIRRETARSGFFTSSVVWSVDLPTDDPSPASSWIYHGRYEPFWDSERQEIWIIDMEKGIVVNDSSIHLSDYFAATAANTTDHSMPKVVAGFQGDTLLIYNDSTIVAIEMSTHKTLLAIDNPSPSEDLFLYSDLFITDRFVALNQLRSLAITDKYSNNSVAQYGTESYFSPYGYLDNMGRLVAITRDNVQIIDLPSQNLGESILAQDVYLNIATCYNRLNDVDNAINYAKKIKSEYNDSHSGANFILLELLCRLGRTDDAGEITYDYYPVLSSSPVQRDRLLILLQRFFGVKWLNEVDLRSWSRPGLLLFGEDQDQLFFCEQAGRPVEAMSWSCDNGDLQWRSVIGDSPMGGGLAIELLDSVILISDELSASTWTALSRSGSVLSACTLSTNRDLSLGSVWLTDTLVNLVLRKREFLSEKRIRRLVSILPGEDGLLTHLNIDEREIAAGARLTLSGTHLITCVGSVPHQAWLGSEFIVESFPDLEYIFTYTPERNIRDFHLTHDTLLFTTDPGNYYMLDLESERITLLHRREFVGELYSAGIWKYIGSTIFDYGESNFLAIDVTASEALGLKWSRSFREDYFFRDSIAISYLGNTDEFLFILGTDNKVRKIDMNSGELESLILLPLARGLDYKGWRRAQVDDKCLYLVSNEGLVYAIAHHQN